MSEPNRYDVGMTTEFNPHGFNHSFPWVYEAEQGKYVEYEDYARLKADAERYRLASLRVDVGELHAQFNRALFDETVSENARLKAEVERLKAEPDALTAYLYADTLRLTTSRR